MELSGKVIAVLPEQRGQGKNGEWVKNSFVVEYMDGSYPIKLCLEVQGDEKWEKMKSNIVVGNDVLVKYGVSSREWQGRWFTSCSCWFAQRLSAVGTQQSSRPSNAPAYSVPTNQSESGEDPDLPF